MLAACAGVAGTPAGTPLEQVVAGFGAPAVQCKNRDGLEHVVWSQQPMGQHAWGTTVDSQGRINAMVPLLTDEHFQVLENGSWTPDQVLCEFGPPAEIETVGLPGRRQTVWSYRYRQDRVWNSLMHVFFDHDGKHVTRFHPGPDPMYEVRENRFMF